MSVNIGELIPTALCLFLLILVGFTVRKANVLNETLTRGLSVIVANVAQPFLII